MSKAADLLVEIGTEELPPKALRSLMETFAANLQSGLDAVRLGHGNVRGFASPRRLAVIVDELERRQADHKASIKGPPVAVAVDEDGNLTEAAIAFARKCGVTPDDLGRTKTDKGEWLSCDVMETGKTTAELLPEVIEVALSTLPIPRRMRWGDGDAEFVRPVHWVVLLHGSAIIKTIIFGIEAGKKSRGHRFHGKSSLTIKSANDYLATLEQDGRVIVDFERRRQMVQECVESAADDVGGTIVDGDTLYDEVAALVEWPVPVTGSFDERFLELPREVVISTLTSHQRYFPVADKNGELLPRFVTVANIDSKDPDQVREGNERVILPRLADAAFFWDTDRKVAFSARAEALEYVVYQQGLGSLRDRVARIGAIAADLSQKLRHPNEAVTRAALLSKCDLLTGMVGEFPELQGTMGRYYALHNGEPANVAEAIGEQYRPRFAGDSLPQSTDGQILAIADKVDAIAGAFVVGKTPSGNRDPFGLRRAALGIIRISVECSLDFDLKHLIEIAVNAQPGGGNAETTESAYDFVTDRLRRYFLDRDAKLDTETFDAVLARHPDSLVDFERRLRAVQSFIELEPASSLAAANKRIANILRQAGDTDGLAVREKLLSDDAELELWSALESARSTVQPMLEARDYTEALTLLAELRSPVDRFFDDVMVMADDKATRNNRLALLGELRALFLDVADISRLAIV